MNETVRGMPIDSFGQMKNGFAPILRNLLSFSNETDERDLQL
jgi:hypothetical protein